ncbi:MAG: DUF192 domain-containing protein [Treponema sp.]|jgi:uncharacterized membrane protein (UPF0127 family)|nr:DUF192 domain-containing protein [Treponema sp.]
MPSSRLWAVALGRAAKTLRLSGLLCCALLLGGACKSATLETRDLTIERQEGEPVILRAEIARSQEERQRGLMFRKDLAEGRGMLFVFDRDQILSFYMKNTRIPLSIAFIRSDGGIAELRNMRPLDETTIQSSRSVRYALEVPQGWFERAGITVGDRLLLSGL